MKKNIIPGYDVDVAESRATRSVVHLGSPHHECWNLQRRVPAGGDVMLSAARASDEGIAGRMVMSWHYDFWRSIPRPAKEGSRAVCFFHHHLAEGFDDPGIVAAICASGEIYHALKRRQPDKPVWLVRPGGAEDARPHALRQNRADRIRILVCGRASAPVVAGEESPIGTTRQGGELVLRIARRLDPARYAWVFVGPDWEGHASLLGERGWTVIAPGAIPEPFHYAFYGEGDIHLMPAMRESAPLPLLQTMGIGIWPVSTSTGLAADLIRDGETGSLVGRYDGSNREEIADAIASRMMGLDRARLAAARPLIASSVAEYTWSCFGAQVRGVLESVFSEIAARADQAPPRRLGLRRHRARLG